MALPKRRTEMGIPMEQRDIDSAWQDSGKLRGNKTEEKSGNNGLALAQFVVSSVYIYAQNLVLVYQS